MHERRNFLLVLLMVAGFGWSLIAWFVLDHTAPLLLVQRTASLLLGISAAAWLTYALRYEDKLPDKLAEVAGPLYYEADGISFMPVVRVKNNRAELCVYYQNRFENPAHAIVHLRPPADPNQSFIIQEGVRDVHFAFIAGGGDFGVIHQPIAVPRQVQGEVIEVFLAAASFYPRSHGARLRNRAGFSCGSMPIDWGGAAFKTGVHEVSGEIKLQNPRCIHLSMPTGVACGITGSEVWKQEQLAPGVAA